MAKRKKLFQKIYRIEDLNNVSDKQMNQLLMVGTENWDHYFSSLVEKGCGDVEEVKNVELVEFDTKKECNKFISSMNKKFLVDISFEHKKPCLLMFAKI